MSALPSLKNPGGEEAVGTMLWSHGTYWEGHHGWPLACLHCPQQLHSSCPLPRLPCRLALSAAKLGCQPLLSAEAQLKYDPLFTQTCPDFCSWTCPLPSYAENNIFLAFSLVLIIFIGLFSISILWRGIGMSPVPAKVYNEHLSISLPFPLPFLPSHKCLCVPARGQEIWAFSSPPSSLGHAHCAWQEIGNPLGTFPLLHGNWPVPPLSPELLSASNVLTTHLTFTLILTYTFKLHPWNIFLPRSWGLLKDKGHYSSF